MSRDKTAPPWSAKKSVLGRDEMEARDKGVINRREREREMERERERERVGIRPRQCEIMWERGREWVEEVKECKRVWELLSVFRRERKREREWELYLFFLHCVYLFDEYKKTQMFSRFDYQHSEQLTWAEQGGRHSVGI